MFDHLGFGVTQLERSKAFYLAALQPLGVSVVMEGPHGVGLGTQHKPALWLFETQQEPAHLHIAMAAATRDEVDAFYQAAIAAGGKDNGPPGLRPQYHADYYGAFVIDPDGHNIEAVCHKPASLATAAAEAEEGAAAESAESAVTGEAVLARAVAAATVA